jgi:hypothetical protein
LRGNEDIVEVLNHRDFPRRQPGAGQPDKRVEVRPFDRRECKAVRALAPTQADEDDPQIDQRVGQRRTGELLLILAPALRASGPRDEALEDLAGGDAGFLVDRVELEALLSECPQLFAEG